MQSLPTDDTLVSPDPPAPAPLSSALDRWGDALLLAGPVLGAFFMAWLPQLARDHPRLLGDLGFALGRGELLERLLGGVLFGGLAAVGCLMLGGVVSHMRGGRRG